MANKNADCRQIMGKSKRLTRKSRRGALTVREEGGYSPSEAELQSEIDKTKWGQTYLTDFLARAQANVRITYLNLKGYFEMLESLGELFKLACESVRYSDRNGFAKACLLGRASGSLFAAVRLSSSGQLSECYTQLRACIESALYAFNMHINQANGQVWLDRHENEVSRKACVKAFSPKKILDALKIMSPSLGRSIGVHYERCIDFGAHPNERSVSTNLNLSNGKISLRLLNTERGMFHACLLICVACGVDVMKAFALLYPNEFTAINAQIRIGNIEQQYARIAPGPLYDLKETPRGGSH